MNRGFILLADLSGFTTFVTETEVRHGTEVVAALLDAVIRRLSPPFDVQEIEGDAVFAVAPDRPPAAAPAIVPIVEEAYVAFRERRRQIRLSTRCSCRACRSIGNLDLKFVVHHGELAAQRIGGREKAAGPAVTLAHRLLKTPSPDTRAWILLTGPAFERAGLTAPNDPFERRRLDCGPLGTVDVYVAPLEPAWQQHVTTATPPTAHRPLFVLEYRLPAPPPTVWDWLTLPELRAQYEPTATAVAGDTAGDAGAVQFRCDHGAFEVLESVREWRPYESCIRDTVTRPLGIPLRSTWRLTDEGGATGLVITVTSPPTAGWFARVAGRFAAPTVRRGIERAMAALGERLN